MPEAINSSVNDALADAATRASALRFADTGTCVAHIPHRRVFPTPAEASAATRGFFDFPIGVETGAAYRIGWHAAERLDDERRSAGRRDGSALRFPMERVL